MPKRYSQKEENIILSSQLYLLEKQAKADDSLIRIIGDLLPGVVLINDMVKLGNSYMNRMGCEFFDKSAEEINSMGAGYFEADNFCKTEIEWIKHHFGALAQRSDPNEVTGFYQRVRRNKNTEWKQFYLSGKILKENTSSFIYMGLQINDKKKSIHKISDVIGVEPLSSDVFQRYNSLTKREKEILHLISQGYTSRYISDLLFISQLTVETHRKNINAKLDVKHLSDLIRISDLFNL